jgi:hypothetical protein
MAKTKTAIKTLKGDVAAAGEVFDRLAEEWERDTWKGQLTDISVGRPRITGDELVNVTFRVPRTRLDVLEAVAKQAGKTRSEYLRDALDRALVADATKQRLR